MSDGRGHRPVGIDWTMVLTPKFTIVVVMYLNFPGAAMALCLASKTTLSPAHPSPLSGTRQHPCLFGLVFSHSERAFRSMMPCSSAKNNNNQECIAGKRFDSGQAGRCNPRHCPGVPSLANRMTIPRDFLWSVTPFKCYFTFYGQNGPTLSLSGVEMVW